MKKIYSVVAVIHLSALAALTADPSLTIYNQNFAVVRDSVGLDLKSGVNEVRFTGATAHLEPDSVILRDPAGKRSLQILEQNYRNDPVSEPLLLSLFEGKTIDFLDTRMKDNTQIRELIPGKIIRSGYVPGGGGGEQPIIEVDGKVRFSLPGQPLFPSLGDDTVLKPTLHWLLRADKPGQFDAEVSYVTGGFSWEADYNLVAPEKGDAVDIIGWITMNNQSGRVFENAKIKLMAGDVNKLQPQNRPAALGAVRRAMLADASEAVVSEKSFDEFHLYTLARATTLRDRETKQVEFVRAEGVKAQTIFVYDGAQGYGYGFYGGLNNDRNYGTQCNKKVWVMREFVNAETNHLGIALPKGKLRFYRRNDDGQLEFTGENEIDHTPRNETIRVTTGNAFDLVGERKQTDFRTDRSDKWIDETFEIKLRNRKKEAADFRVVEHLYRWNNWKLTTQSDDFKKTDAQTIEFRVTVKPDE
ncbi:MAG: hypothetical protein EPO07_07310, partial [Verrucomicrobia bacterium]